MKIRLEDCPLVYRTVLCRFPVAVRILTFLSANRGEYVSSEAIARLHAYDL